MAIHILRKWIQKTGFDIHRFRPGAQKMDVLRHLGINTVLDIGANKGQFASEIRSILPQATIHSFEPLKDCFKVLENKFTHDHHFYAYNYALGDTDTAVSMHKNDYTPSSSILEMSDNHKTLFPHTTQSSLEMISIKKLDDIAPTLHLEKNILIKIDVQGFEDKVISGGINTFTQCDAILIENSFVTLYENQPLFSDIYKTLTSLGFEYRGALQEKINREDGSIISEDSLFIKK